MSELIEVTCKCGKVFKAKPEFAGRTGKCRACGAMILIPDPRQGPSDPYFDELEPEPEPKPAKRPLFKKPAAVVSPSATVVNHITIVNRNSASSSSSSSSSCSSGCVGCLVIIFIGFIVMLVTGSMARRSEENRLEAIENARREIAAKRRMEAAKNIAPVIEKPKIEPAKPTPVTLDGLDLQKQKEIYVAINHAALFARDKANKQFPSIRDKPTRSRFAEEETVRNERAVQLRFKLTEDQMEAIKKEGSEHQWPTDLK